MAQASKVIAVTGVTSGLGAAMTQFFTRHSHLVVGCGRTNLKIEELNSKYGSNRFHVVDVSKNNEVEHWVRQIIADFGVPDILINNASIANKTSKFWRVPPEDFDNAIDINIKGVANALRHFLPHMVKAKRGIVVNMSAAWGKSVSPGVSAYCASKFAIEGFSKAVASELPDPLACVPLDPGVINTPMLQKIFGNAAAKQQTPDTWVEKAGPMILDINRTVNGKSLKVK
ncbi:uncharacterized protein LOC135691769 [Rhopilema esculentum]|uniref:uncharacterized protein LOC135691769 n=1 Tax=Rhopilema esculentum TaxID=499914 RepID=UPI0031D0EB0B|eukprot:gene9593-17351_t